jgi:cystathionine gamma-synthase
MTGKGLHPSTIAAQALGWVDVTTGAVVLPVHVATTFLRDPDNQYRRGRSYGRAGNPSYDQPQALLTALEGGADSLLFSSGMAARLRRFFSACRAKRMSSHQGSCIGVCAIGSRLSPKRGGSKRPSVT